MLPDAQVTSDLKTMCDAIHEQTTPKSTEMVDIEVSTNDKEAHPVKDIDAKSPSELQSVLEIKELALQMVLTTLVDESDDSLENTETSAAVLQKIRTVRKQIELIKNWSFQKDIEGTTGLNKNIQFALTIINFIMTILSIFIVIFGFSGDDTVVNSVFA